MGARAKVNDFIKKYGVGELSLTGNVKGDIKVRADFYELMYRAETISNIKAQVYMKFNNIKVNDIVDDIYLKTIEECVNKYNNQKLFYDYLIEIFGFRVLTMLENNQKNIEKFDYIDDVTPDDDVQQKELPSTENKYDTMYINENLISFISSIVNTVKGLKRSKYVIYRLLYTDLFLLICEGYSQFAVDNSKHRRDLLETLDYDFIRFLYKDNPQNVVEYRMFPRNTIHEVDDYFDGKDVLPNVIEDYRSIFPEPLRKNIAYDTEIPLPVKPDSIYTAFVYLKESEDGTKEATPHVPAYISNYKKSFEEEKNKYKTELKNGLNMNCG